MALRGNVRLNGARVLVVEGHDDTLEMNRITLSTCGAEVRTAPSGEAALDMLRQWTPDALLTDLRLPGMSAYELVERVASQSGARVRCVGTSSEARPHERAKALEHGFCDCLTKPVDPNELCRAIARAIGRSEVQS
jgi:two-component system CheB/CheR fusion protein